MGCLNEEQLKYELLSEKQKAFVDDLKEIGFKYMYFTTYGLAGWGSVDVSKLSKNSDLLKLVHQQGKESFSFDGSLFKNFEIN